MRRTAARISMILIAARGLFAGEEPAVAPPPAPLTSQEMTDAVKKYVAASVDERKQLLADWSGRAPLKPDDVSRWAKTILTEVRKAGPKLKPVPTDMTANLPPDLKRINKMQGVGVAPVATVETPSGPMRVAVLATAGAKKEPGTIVYLHGGGGSTGGRDNEMTWGWGVKRTSVLTCASTRLLARCLEKDDSATNAWILPHEAQAVSAVLDAYLRTEESDPDRVYLVGHSMGGYGTWIFASIEPDRYGAIVDVAGEAHRPTYENFRNVDFGAFLGLKDHRAAKAKEGIDALKALNEKNPGFYRSHWTGFPEKGHDIAEKEYKEIDVYLKPLKRDSYPRVVVWRPVVDWKKRFYNIGVENPAPKKTDIRAEMGADNTITVTSSGADAITVYLNDRLSDFKKDVVVVWNGRRVFAGRLNPALDVMLETLADHCDAGMFYTAKVELRTGMPEVPVAAAP